MLLIMPKTQSLVAVETIPQILPLKMEHLVVKTQKRPLEVDWFGSGAAKGAEDTQRAA